VEVSKRIVLLILKTAVILLIPYFWLFDSSSTVRTYTIISTWGIWHQGSYSVYTDDLGPIWLQNQILYSLLFIIPLLLFSLIFSNRAISRDSIIAAVVSVFASFIILDLLTPDYYFTQPYSYQVVPNVISLAIFVFVFWPIIRNSWPLPKRDENAEKEQGIRNKIRRFQHENFPFDVATFTWIGLSILPAVFALTVDIVPEMHTLINFSFSGGLTDLYYSYNSNVFSGSAHPLIQTSLILATAHSVSISALPIWSFNLLLAIITLRCILGKSTKKRVYSLVAISILIYTIPSVLFVIVSIISGMGYYPISLPIYPLLILVFTKYVHAPSQSEQGPGEMIQVPLRTRISSIFERGRSKKESPSEVEAVSEEDSEISDT